jgi:hypothetical protein
VKIPEKNRFVTRLFEHFLGRVPESAEVLSTWEKSFSKGNWEETLRSFVYSEEALYKNLEAAVKTDLLVAKVALASFLRLTYPLQHKVWFMHIPKTSGSSLVNDIESWLKYPMVRIHQNLNREFIQRPLLGGSEFTFLKLVVTHRPLCDFANVLDSHNVFTILREPRSRLLSAYRFYTSDRVVAEARRENPNLFLILTENKEKPLGEWLQTMTALQFPAIAPQLGFLSCDQDITEASTASQIHNAGEVVAQDVRLRLAMCEDQVGVSQLTRTLFGERFTPVSKINTFQSAEMNGIDSLSTKDLEILHHYAEPDYTLISALIRFGRIPSTYEAQMSTYFAETAARLRLKCV